MISSKNGKLAHHSSPIPRYLVWSKSGIPLNPTDYNVHIIFPKVAIFGATTPFLSQNLVEIWRSWLFHSSPPPFSSVPQGPRRRLQRLLTAGVSWRTQACPLPYLSLWKTGPPSHSSDSGFVFQAVVHVLKLLALLRILELCRH